MVSGVNGQPPREPLRFYLSEPTPPEPISRRAFGLLRAGLAVIPDLLLGAFAFVVVGAGSHYVSRAYHGLSEGGLVGSAIGIAAGSALVSIWLPPGRRKQLQTAAGLLFFAALIIGGMPG